MRLVLSENADPQVAGIDEVGEHEIDQAIGATEGNCGFGPVRGQRIQPLALTAGQDDAQHVWRFPHGFQLIGRREPLPGGIALSASRLGKLWRAVRQSIWLGSTRRSPRRIVPPDWRTGTSPNYGAEYAGGDDDS